MPQVGWERTELGMKPRSCWGHVRQNRKMLQEENSSSGFNATLRNMRIKHGPLTLFMEIVTSSGAMLFSAEM